MDFVTGFNRLAERIFGVDPTGDRRVWLHWQNLNEKTRGSKTEYGSGLVNGRAWLHYPNAHRRAAWNALRAEWHLGRIALDVGLDFRESDREIMFHVAIPGVALYLSADNVPLPNGFWKDEDGRYTGRSFGLGIRDWKIWWDCWAREMEWRSGDPKWMHGCFDFPDFFLGKQKYKNEELEDHLIKIPMPEGEYMARATFERSTWKRPRAPARVRAFTRVDVLTWGGIPHEGKGENSWDCGTDGLYGYSVEGHDLAKAIARGVESSLDYRRRYDGSLKAKYPSPVVTAKEGIQAFAKYIARVNSADKEKTRLLRSNDGSLVHILHDRSGRPQLLTTTSSALAEHWPDFPKLPPVSVSAEV